jgi:N-sulfoglucosamine sulfohydrolase
MARIVCPLRLVGGAHPSSIRVPWLQGGFRTDALASAVDFAPTLLDRLGLAPLPVTHGHSLRPVLEGWPAPSPRDYVFVEISDHGPLPNDGLQERSVCDGRCHLIDRDKLTPPWRQI